MSSVGVERVWLTVTVSMTGCQSVIFMVRYSSYPCLGKSFILILISFHLFCNSSGSYIDIDVRNILCKQNIHPGGRCGVWGLPLLPSVLERHEERQAAALSPPLAGPGQCDAGQYNGLGMERQCSNLEC